MEHKFLTKQFKLVGVEEKIDFNGDFPNQIATLQKKLFSRLNEIKNIISTDSYTAFWFYKTNHNTAILEAEIYYLAAVEVSEIELVPEGFISKNVPRSEYVVFNEKVRGEIGGTEGYAYTTWLPESGREINHEVAGDFEIYNSRYNIGPECECEIYIPIV